jgi:DNA-binding transcriptional ArsR family regulator
MSDSLTATFAALADPTRRAMLSRLARGPATVNELAAPFELSLPTVSRHLKVLEDAGLVVKERDKQFRPCRLETAPLETADQWMEPYRQFFGERLDRLDQQLQAMMAARRDAAKTKKEGDEK